MYRLLGIFLIAILAICSSKAQGDFNIVSGPMYGHFTDSTQHFWMMLQPSGFSDPYQNWTANFNQSIHKYFEDSTDFSIDRIIESTVVDEKKEYIIVRGVLNKKNPQPITKDFSFLLGSCSMPMPFPLLFMTKKRQRIFDAMTIHEKDFMLWMGDNVYYLFGQWNTKQKMHKQNIKSRTNPKIRSFLESCPQYAIWDDHDFGPNNSNVFYGGKYNSLDIFKKYWANPSYGLDTAMGVFHHFRQGDAEFFMLDGRFHAYPDSSLLGKAQTDWLKEKLKKSTANFKFIVSSVQVVSTGIGEDLGDYGAARQDLYDFITEEKITGVIILSGDRHYAELLKLERAECYPIYEMTTSPLTSIINTVGYEKNLQERIPNTLIFEQNFGKVHIFGPEDNRKCRLELYNVDGVRLWQYDIRLSDLQY